jgi:HlyD family secretion protein
MEMFRKEALQRMQSPDSLDQLLVVVTPKSWILLLTISALCAVAVVWSVIGRIPISVDGFGVLINPGNVKGIQSEVSGEITQLNIQVGQLITEGDVIAELNQPELRQQLEQAKENLAEVTRFAKVADELDRERLELETSAAEEQQRSIEGEIARSRDLVEKSSQTAIAFAEKQRENLSRSRELLGALNDSLGGRVKTISQLREEGLSSQDSVISARSTFMDSELKVANIAVQYQELELQEVQRQQSELQSQNRLGDLRLQLKQFPIKLQQLNQQLMHGRRNRELESSELRNRIKMLEFQLNERSKIESNYTGRVLELSISAGQLIGAGSRIATVEVDDPDAELMNMAYFKIKDGKRVKPGDKVLVTPATVQRERFGSMIGTVREVASFPITKAGAVNEIGSSEIVEELLSGGGAIEIEASLERDPDTPTGFKWTSKGPDVRLTAGTTTTVRVVIEQRRPITYVIPILRTWIMGQKDDQKPDF